MAAVNKKMEIKRYSAIFLNGVSPLWLKVSGTYCGYDKNNTLKIATITATRSNQPQRGIERSIESMRLDINATPNSPIASKNLAASQ